MDQYDADAKSFAHKLRHCVVGAEALLPRVQDSKEEAHYFPDEIVNAADQDPSLVKDLGRKVIQTTIAQLAKWNSKLNNHLFTMNINLSPNQLEYDPELVDFIDQTLRKSNVEPSQVQFELTEDPKFEPTDENIAKMQSIKALGCKLALDDIGSVGADGVTPKAKIENAQYFDVNTVKIDRSQLWMFQDLRGKSEKAQDALKRQKEDSYSNLIQNIRTTLESQFGYGDAKPYAFVAEGVEDVRGVQLMKDLGVEFIQGWVYAEKENPHKFEDHYLPTSSAFTGTLATPGEPEVVTPGS